MKTKNIILIVLILIFFFSSVFFRIKIINFVLNRFTTNSNLELSLTEREELKLLKQKNKILEVDNKNLQNNLGILNDEPKPSFVKSLIFHSNFYGDFYTTLPKDKTPYKGMNVFANGDVVVGQIIEVLDNSLKVGNLAVGSGVIVEDLETNEFLEIHALGNGLYSASLSGGSKIAVGSQIVMKGFPRAIVGEVTEVNKTGSSLTNILIQAPYNILTKDIYYVIQ